MPTGPHRIPARTLAIDIGGTKFSMAVFHGDRMVERITRATDREGGREWMLSQIESVAHEWSQAHSFDPCGVGFGGPVDFASQTVALSTHVGGWQNFPLASHLRGVLRVPVIMDNDANVGGLGEAVLWRWKGMPSIVLHDAFYRDRRGYHHRDRNLSWRRFVRW